MPYKDPERKKEWERLHRAERWARRRQLRQIEAVDLQPQPRAETVELGNAALLILVGCVILVLALFFHSRKEPDSKAVSTKPE